MIKKKKEYPFTVTDQLDKMILKRGVDDPKSKSMKTIRNLIMASYLIQKKIDSRERKLIRELKKKEK